MRIRILNISKKILNNEVKKIIDGRCVMFCYEPKKPKQIIIKDDKDNF